MSTTLIRAAEAKLTLNPTPPEAIEAINSALAKSALVPDEIDTELEQAQAVNAQRDIASLLKEIEKARVAAKQPALDFGRLVDARAKELIKELEPEQMRIAKAVGNYQQRELEKVREAQRKADAERAEIERKQREAKAAELKRVWEEEQKRLAEIRKAELEANAEKVRAMREAAEAARKKAEEESKIRAERAAQELAQVKVVEAPVKAEGQSVRKEIRIEITDIWTLAKMHPGLVKIEPRNAEIKEMIRLGHKVAGVRSWEETISSVRVGKQQQVLEV